MSAEGTIYGSREVLLKNMKIGILDSGLGGLSVLHRALKMLPDAVYLYYADEKHVPYGEKNPEDVRRYLREIFKFMLDKKVDAIVVACNTATSILPPEFRELLPVPLVGMEPAVKKAVDLYASEEKRILAAATPITVGGKKLQELVERVDTKQAVDLIALPRLVRFAEQGQFTAPQICGYLKEELRSFNLNTYGTVVLGCTHFNYFKRQLRQLFPPETHFVDGNEGTVRQLMRLLSLVENEPEGGKLPIKKGAGSGSIVGSGSTACEESVSAADKEPHPSMALNAGAGSASARSVEYYFSGEAVGGDELSLIDKCMQQLDSVFDID